MCLLPNAVLFVAVKLFDVLGAVEPVFVLGFEQVDFRLPALSHTFGRLAELLDIIDRGDIGVCHLFPTAQAGGCHYPASVMRPNTVRRRKSWAADSYCAAIGKIEIVVQCRTRDARCDRNGD